MKLGKVLTYRDVNEAKRLIGKRVEYSDNLKAIEESPLESGDILLEVIEDSCEPFRIDTSRYSSQRTIYDYQFIREILPDESHYEPYDLSDPKVRDSLRGRWIIWNDGDTDDADEAVIIGFTKQDGDPWKIQTSIGSIDTAELLKFYVFDDGTPCGRRVE